MGVRAASARARAMPSRTPPTGSRGLGVCPGAARDARSRRRRSRRSGSARRSTPTSSSTPTDAGAPGDQLAGPALRRRGRASCERRAGDDKRADLRRTVLDRRLVRPEPGPVAAADAIRTRRGPDPVDPVAEGLLRRRPHRRRPLGPRCRPSASSAPTARYLADALALVDGAASADPAARRVRRTRRTHHRGRSASRPGCR